MRHRIPFQPSNLNRWGVIALAAGLCVSVFAILSTCRSDRVTVNPNDPRSPKYAYRLDELALLQMATDDILNLERKKQYGVIYDEYTSREFQKNVSRRRFLIMSNCVETYLGGLQEFDSNDLGFNRKLLKGQRYSLDILTRKVQRDRGKVDEQLVFIPSGFNFKLNGLYWISKDKIFLQCIADSPQIEANTAPMPKALPTTPTEEGQPSTSQAVTPEPGTPAPTPSGETPEQPAPEGPPLPAPPTPAAEPGAGGVMDTRPEEPQEKAPTPPSEPKTQGRARGNRGVAMPLEPSEPATASN